MEAFPGDDNSGGGGNSSSLPGQLFSEVLEVVPWRGSLKSASSSSWSFSPMSGDNNEAN